jgi:tetratricopeptide (TPR) repeat protein
MSRLATFAIAGALLLAPRVHAQEAPSPNSPRVSPQAAPSAPPMPPREAAEIHADILVARKMYREGIAEYEKLLREQPKNAVLMNKTGVAYQAEGDLGAAQRYYKRALKADPRFSTPLNNLGTIEYSRKHYRKAIRYYDQAIKIRTDVPGVYSNLGYAYFGDNRYTEAMNAFEKALAIDPKIFEHHGAFGSLVEERGIADPGLFNFLLAKSYARAGDASHCAHFLKMARDEGYKDYVAAKQDPDFARVIKDPEVQAIFEPQNPVASSPQSPSD